LLDGESQGVQFFRQPGLATRIGGRYGTAADQFPGIFQWLISH
jgi:hypothetical protein